MRPRWLVAAAGALTLAVALGTWAGPLQVSRGNGPPGLSLVSSDGAGKPLDTANVETAMSGDGRFLAFSGAGGMWIKNLESGALVPVRAPGTAERVLGGSHPVLSGDGGLLVFDSRTDGLAPGDRAGKSDVFVKDLHTGELRTVTGGPAFARQRGAFVSDMSADGRRILLGTGTGGSQNQRLWLVDETGKATSIGDRHSYGGSISADGNTVVFTSNAYDATTRHVGAFKSERRVLLKDLRTGRLTTLNERANLRLSPSSRISSHSDISADGSRVAFVVSSLEQEADPEARGIYVADLNTGAVIHRVRNRTGKVAVAESPVLSADGRHLMFASEDNDLVRGDLALGPEIFLTDLESGATRKLSSPRRIRTDTYQSPHTMSFTAPGPVSADGTAAVLFTTIEQSVRPGTPFGYGGFYLARLDEAS
ncbi:MAG: TolB family protein [Sporichthyaceae bacterium]